MELIKAEWVDRIRNSKKSICDLLDTQERLEIVLEEEENINYIIQSMGLNNVEDYVYAFPVAAYEEDIIDIDFEEEKYTVFDLEKAITKFYKERKSAMDEAIEDFKDSELYQMYLEVLVLQKHYENLLNNCIK